MQRLKNIRLRNVWVKKKRRSRANQKKANFEAVHGSTQHKAHRETNSINSRWALFCFNSFNHCKLHFNTIVTTANSGWYVPERLPLIDLLTYNGMGSVTAYALFAFTVGDAITHSHLATYLCSASACNSN